jgi:hypothetical protein
MADINVSSKINFSNTYNSKALMLIDGHDIEYWVKEFTLPSISIAHEQVARTPAGFKLEGNIWTYNDLNITFYVDEDFSSYYRLYNWLFQGLNGQDFKRMKTNSKILILNNQLTEIVGDISINGLMISELSEFTYNNFGTDPLTMNIRFTYDRMIPVFKKATSKN